MRSPPNIADSLTLLADLMELADENDFKIRAYRVASEICENFPKSTDELLKQIKSLGIPKIGENLARKIHELAEKAETEELSDLKAKVPLSVLELRRVPGLGPKKVKLLWKELKIQNLKSLKEACMKGLLKDIKGFGEKTASSILEKIAQLEKYDGFIRLSKAVKIYNSLKDLILEKFPNVQISETGELRRSCEILKSVDILLAGINKLDLIKLGNDSGFFIEHKEFEDHIEFKTVDTNSVNFYFVVPDEFAFELFQKTGSHEFNQWFDSKFKIDEKTKWSNEKAIFEAAKISFIVPEFREKDNLSLWADVTENEAEELVSIKDIKGIIHCHSTYSDGVDTLKDMAIAAKERGFLYLGVCDHSVSAKYAGGLTLEKIASQHAEIDRLNKELTPFVILKGIESDILADGSLDYEENTLKQFDFVVASVHSQFKMSKEDMTKRIIRAVENPFTSILGHATGRLLLEREGYAVDLDAVISAAVKSGVALEINANPYRLDLDWRWVKVGIEKRAKFSIDPDAHRIAAFNDIEYGVAVARKAGLKAKDVVTSLDSKAFLKALKL